MKYQLFISDFDGTLVRRDGTVSPRTRAAITRYMESGGIFAVCTGRMPSSILPRVRELGITKGPVVAYQGAVVVEIETGAILKADGLPFEDALAVLRVLERAGEHIHLYTADTLYCNRDDEYLAEYERICGVKGTVLNKPLSEFLLSERPTVIKILAMLDPARRDGLKRMLEGALGERFYVTASADFLVEVLPAGRNKARGVDFLSEYYNVPLEGTAAIGDQLNDLPMVLRAGGRFTVENAAEDLKRIALVMPSNEDDGVAYALENYVMG